MINQTLVFKSLLVLSAFATLLFAFLHDTGG
jgi:hypothetical protein